MAKKSLTVKSKVTKTKSGSTRTYTKSMSGKWSLTGWSGKTPRSRKKG